MHGKQEYMTVMKFSSVWEYPKIPGGTTNLNHLMFKISSPTDNQVSQRKPLVLVLVLDKSWSMKGEKLNAVIEAACTFVNWLTRHDYIGIVAYSSDVQVVQPITRLEQKSTIIHKLQSIQPGTSTNLSGGWLQGLKMAAEVEAPDSIRRVILLTDGLATMGIQLEEQLQNIAEKHVNNGISTTTIGFGNDFNEHSLHEISKAGKGNFYYIDSPEKTSDIFFKEFGEVGALYAQAIDLEIDLHPKVKFLELFSEANIENDSEKLKIKLGDMRSDDIRNVLLGFEIDTSDGIPEKPFDAQLSYYRIGGGSPEKAQVQIQGELSKSEGSTEPNKEVEIELLVTWAGKTMMQASQMAENDVNGAQKLLENMINRVQEKKKIAPSIFSGIISRLKEMQKTLREDLNTARKQLLATGSVIYSDRSEIGMVSRVNMHDRVFTYEPKGDLDLYNAPELKSIVRTKLEEGFRFVVFDMANCGFIDSSAIGSMIQIANWLTRRGGALVVSNLSSTLEKIFIMTRIDMYIPVAESVTGAKMIIESRKSNESETH